MFSTWLNKALNKLGRSSYIIDQEILFMEDFQSRLPDNFYAVREAWLCTEVNGYPYRSANSFYSQAASASTIQISPMIVDGQPCNPPVCQPDACDPCMPNLVQAVYKTNNEMMRTFQKQYLLKPGNISARKSCDVEYTREWDTCSTKLATPYSSAPDSFDIRDNKLVTNFRQGIVHLVFYATEYDEIGNQMIPDNYRIKEYVEAFLKYKLIEMLTNQVTDETYRQMEEKLRRYEALANEAFIIAMTEIKKPTSWERQRSIKHTLNRFGMYELPSGESYTRNRSNRENWRRNF
jgi:hypothetical protein